MAVEDFFRARLETMIDMRHPLAVLSTHMPWAEIETSLAPAFAHQDRTGKARDGADLFGPTSDIAGAGVSARGRRRPPIQWVVALLYLKHAFTALCGVCSGADDGVGIVQPAGCPAL